MTKEELAVGATFLVADVRKEIAGSEQGEVYATLFGVYCWKIRSQIT
jgi:hypothetical protein